jgi:EmrB/QacA subfamily drug resistance transporter
MSISHSTSATIDRSSGTEVSVPSQNDARRWWTLAVLGMAQLMILVDSTIVTIALPSAQHALRFSDADRQWIVTAYALGFGGLLLFGGLIADVIGRKMALIIGLIGFAGASAIGGASTSFFMLVSARAVQGVFAALLAPAVLALLTTTFTENRERGRAFAIYGAIAGAGATIGLILGGLLTSYLSWRYTLFVNLVFAAIAVAGALLLLQRPQTAHHDPIDRAGVLTVTGGMFSLVYGLAHAQTTSWTDTYTLVFLALGLGLLGVFGWVEARVHHPLLPLRVVLNRTRGGSILATLFSAASVFGLDLFLTYYLQTTLDFSPLKTGVAFLPLIGAVLLATQVANEQLLTRFGPRPVVPVGMVLGAVGLFMLTQLTVASSYATDVLPYLVLMGIGLGMVLGPAVNSATLGVETVDAGAASASVNTASQIGGSIGIALLSTLGASAAAAYLAGRKLTHDAVAMASVQTDTTAFLWASVMLAVGAVVSGLVLESGAPAAPVLPHTASLAGEAARPPRPDNGTTSGRVTPGPHVAHDDLIPIGVMKSSGDENRLQTGSDV